MMLLIQMKRNSVARYGNHVVYVFAGSDARPIWVSLKS